jgi:hypothetical protein
MLCSTMLFPNTCESMPFNKYRQVRFGVRPSPSTVRFLLLRCRFSSNAPTSTTTIRSMCSIKTTSIVDESFEEKSQPIDVAELSTSSCRSCRTRDNPADLDDKTHLDGMDERYSRLGIVEDLTDGEYDDEYDDTYDDGTVNVQDKDDQIDKDLVKNENRCQRQHNSLSETMRSCVVPCRIVGKQPGHYRHRVKSDDDDDDDTAADGNSGNASAQVDSCSTMSVVRRATIDRCSR